MINKTEITAVSLGKMIEDQISQLYGVSGNEANNDQLYKGTALAVNEILRARRKAFNSKVKEQKQRRVYYLSMEFLMGKSLKNNLYNLGITAEAEQALAVYGVTLEDLYECEPDAALGNGGLGRLGACYLDALAGIGYPAMGFSIRYEYGLFKQKITDGYQTELPDIWLPGGEVWLTKRPDKVLSVKFDGYVEKKINDGRTVYEYHDYNEVEAVPYDMMVSGAGGNGISVLRLWRSRNIRNFDLHSFSDGDYLKATREYNEAELISKVLYPSDNHYQGKTLRLKQQYFLCSASVQNIVIDHMRYHGDISSLPEYSVIHINDTHPALSIPELIRILTDEYRLDFDEALKITREMVDYTNHTVLAEALECWDENLIRRRLPRIHLIIEEIDRRFIEEARFKGASDPEIRHLRIIGDGQVRMANLCVIVSRKVNGVSLLHTKILKETVFEGYNRLYPDKLINVTNGIAYRRWLGQSNPALSGFLDVLIGKEYRKDASVLSRLLVYGDNDGILKKLDEIKYRNKCRFAAFLHKKAGIAIDPTTRFDVQVKRLHEYKRQLLNVLKIIALLTDLEEDPYRKITPQTYIFGGKAAPTYYVAKDIILLITSLAAEIAKRPEIGNKLNVVFLEDYNVSAAEILIPASEVSEQISLAGKEASGTGNMKFMINGALTLGTLDGANVEICERVGRENIFIFGMKADEVSELWKRGYNARWYYDNNCVIKRVLDRLDRGFNGKSFSNIKKYLLNQYPLADPYMCLADFDDYMRVYYEMDEVYRDRRRWNQMVLINIAEAGAFSADRSIEKYAREIWRLEKVK